MYYGNPQHELYPELTEQGKREAQLLMNRFEKELKDKATDIIKSITTDFYCGVLNEIESDHWTNYRTKILQGLCNYQNKEINVSYDFDRIRMSIYKNHKEDIVKDLNQDLLKEIDELKEQLKKAYQRI